jgi:hypothetical protein
VRLKRCFTWNIACLAGDHRATSLCRACRISVRSLHREHPGPRVGKPRRPRGIGFIGRHRAGGTTSSCEACPAPRRFGFAPAPRRARLQSHRCAGGCTMIPAVRSTLEASDRPAPVVPAHRPTRISHGRWVRPAPPPPSCWIDSVTTDGVGTPGTPGGEVPMGCSRRDFCRSGSAARAVSRNVCEMQPEPAPSPTTRQEAALPHSRKAMTRRQPAAEKVGPNPKGWADVAPDDGGDGGGEQGVLGRTCSVAEGTVEGVIGVGYAMRRTASRGSASWTGGLSA